MEPELEKLVKESGHNLHLDVYEILKNGKWKADLAAYYVDDISDKPREVDIQAVRPFLGSRAPSESIETLFSTFLFVECKWFKKPIAIHSLENSDVANTAIVTANIDRKGLTDYPYGPANYHHYVKAGHVGKLYVSEEHNEIFNALTGAVKSLCFHLGTRQEKGFYYPIVVFDGINGLYDIFNRKDNGIVERAIIAFNYSYRDVASHKPITRLFYVDFVHRKKLDELLKDIQAEEMRAYKFVTGAPPFP
ncbi:MAG: hypothetical protein Q7S50_01180 [bacterium]|nr:hypothetical protein [bacterium]